MVKFIYFSELPIVMKLCVQEREEQYHVSLDWLLDSQQYNEWMNEQDYELEENGKIKVLYRDDGT